MSSGSIEEPGDVRDCVLIPGGGRQFEGRQNVSYFEGISAQSAGSKALCLHVMRLPPGGHAEPHLHADHESAVYVISGTVEHRWGDGLRERMLVLPGDFLYIPAGVPHAPYNASDTEPAVAVLARTDPNEQESVVLLPDLSVPDR
ncbi:putative RmlC-like cupin family protein [Allocatelliglobosispora scoriae]|uniref:Putative RmlC-like cupin family protein n=1 Tax=Allocatelliglobosispora scoriae TaxID=643052 RepID=A0A841C2F3_9ACTN|nr:cupin domain-containing protein [Allocatelliglobosispora scoriae]MBB5874534.1 putative RmlC-like cupin family protein [Allocatelliglobosispora scoriae]